MVRVQQPHSTAFVRGETRDFGEGGLGAAIEGELTPDAVVSLRVALPQCALMLQPLARVRYGNGSVHGFEFMNLSALQLAEVRNCCRRLAALES
jgi:hypothetical protein